MSETFPHWQRIATLLLLPGIVLRNIMTVFSLAFFAESDDVDGDVDTVFRDDPWLARLRSVVRWNDLDADWPLDATVRTMIPVFVLLIVYPYHDKVTYPLTHPSAAPAYLWLPLAYVLANFAYAALVDILAVYVDAYSEARTRWLAGDSEGETV